MFIRMATSCHPDREFLDYYKNESLPYHRQELNDLLQHSPPTGCYS